LAEFTADIDEQLAEFRRTRDDVAETTSRLFNGSGMLGGSGPLGNALFWLIELLEGAQKARPFAVGDLVELIETPDLTKADGWRHGATYLVAGSPAIVESVQLNKHGWMAYVYFERDPYSENRGLYGFCCSKLRRREAT
jgi:hypothetical protein